MEDLKFVAEDFKTLSEVIEAIVDEYYPGESKEILECALYDANKKLNELKERSTTVYLRPGVDRISYRQTYGYDTHQALLIDQKELRA